MLGVDALGRLALGQVPATPLVDFQAFATPIWTRTNSRLAIVLMTTGAIGPVLNPNTQIIQKYESRWHYTWSEPVRVKPRLHPALQPFTAYTNPTPLPNPRLTLYRPWMDPVRLKPGLRAGLQQTFTGPIRLLPPINVTITMSAFEINNDIFFAGVTLYGAPVTARVSIKEIPAIRGAAASIEET